MNSALYAELLSRRHLLILERQGAGTFSQLGLTPGWFSNFLPEGAVTERMFEPAVVFPFLEHFLPEAERFWSGKGEGELRSGIWTEESRDQREIHLDAAAHVVAARKLLLVRRIETEFGQLHRALQRGRELSIVYDRLISETAKKEILLHCIIHDLSGPLSGISATLDLLRKEELSDETQRFVELGRLAARQQANLISNLLDTFRAELGSVDSTVADGAHAPDVIECAREVLSALQPAFAIRGVIGRLQLARELPARLAVIGERNRLQRVLHNLFQNALRHSLANGTVTVAIQREGSNVFVAVEDEGPGIPPDIAPQLFQKFVRGRGASGKAGLGLFFCRITVEQWGGKIGCEPRTNGGTRFWFRLNAA